MFGAVISVFAPVAAQEFARVLHSPKGLLVVAYPGERHLIELKCRLYKEPKLFTEDSLPFAELQKAGFEQKETVRVKKELVLTQGEALDLLGMTPFYWHAPLDITSQLALENEPKMTIEVLLTVFWKA